LKKFDKRFRIFRYSLDAFGKCEDFMYSY